MGTKRFLITEDEKREIMSLYNYKGLLQEQKNQPKEYTLDTIISLENSISARPELKLFPGTKFVLKFKNDGKPYLITDKSVISQYVASDTGRVFGDEDNIVDGKKNKAVVYYNCSTGKFGTKNNTSIKNIEGDYGSPEKMSWYAQPNQVAPFNNVCKTKQIVKTTDQVLINAKKCGFKTKAEYEAQNWACPSASPAEKEKIKKETLKIIYRERGGGGTGTKYQACTETYVKGCISDTIKKIQGCLGLSVDGKMGPNTVSAVSAKIGRSYFTDADVEKLCGGKVIDGGQDLEIPDSDQTKIEQPKPTSDQIEFGGEEY